MDIRAVIFDLDGVICDTHQIHFEAYRSALLQIFYYDMTWEHYNSIGTPPTRVRTQYLLEHGFIHTGDDYSKVEKLHQLKKEITAEKTAFMGEDSKLQDLLAQGQERFGLKYGIASNASDGFVAEVLGKKNISHFFDSIIGSYNVVHTKPSPEMYLISMANLNVGPRETIILEDSNLGLVAAYKSGAIVYRVNNPDDVNHDLLDLIKQLNN